MARQPHNPNHIYIGHVRYALKYVASQSVNEVRMESYDPTAVQWVSAAESVRSIVSKCLFGS